ncbi:TonB-dependent receptor [Fulvivirgaceae bacterium BMA10]|uniref:TonB-dependent receptor n=1 Tax=Splendidivirga corallicola TaxID=3051826 RepID=A0ABT8KUH4_9BACT|nr:TonB-dependent receptor [Fulvivirgaceae bacterium BMA10]
MKKILLISFLFATGLFAEAWAQGRSVTGKVTSQEDGSGLPGVNIILKGTSVGTTSDVDGNYSIEVPGEGAILIFSFIGFSTAEVEVGNRSIVNVNLLSDTKTLSEIVIQAYGAQSAAKNIQSISEIDGGEIQNVPTITPQQALNGKVAGVRFTGTTGILGGETNLQIRGVASITSGTRPLYVIDGVPLNDVDISDGLGGADGLDPLIDLNSNDIENIAVLKDASATALYGSRGANGVVLITTKSGKDLDGKTHFNFDFYTGWSEPTITRDLLTADQFRQIRSEVSQARGGSLTPDQLPQGNFDWLDAILQTGRVNNYNFSASGGSDKTQYYMGGSYSEQENHWIGNDLEKFNGRFNFSHQASDYVKFGWNVSISRTEGDRSNTENSTFSPYTVANLQLPYILPVDDNGNFVSTGFIENVIAIEELNLSKLITRRVIGNTFLEIEPIEELFIKADFGADIQQSEETGRTPALLAPPAGTGDKDIQQVNKWLATVTARYATTIGQNHNVSGTIGFTYESQKQSQLFANGNTFISDQLITLNNAANITGGGSFETGFNLSGTFARANYDYNSKYLLEGSIRRDGSSRFGANNRFGTFWSAKAGWILSEEAFLSNFRAIDFLRVSVGYGTTGNDRIGNFASAGLFGAGNDYAGISGIEVTQPANPDLRWEQTAQLDISLKAELFNNRLGIDFSWYDKRTSDGLLNVPIPVTTGFTSRVENVGEIRNTGVDLAIDVVNIRAGEFTWKTNYNVGFLKNEVLSLPGAAQDDDGNEFIASGNQRAVVGRSINEFFLTRFLEIDPQTGDPVWLTKDGERTSSLSAADRVFAGSAIPDYSGGITNTFTWKGLTASVFVSFVKGNSILNDDQGFVENLGSGGFNHSTRVLDYWRQPGDVTLFPRLDSPLLTTYDNASTLRLVSGSHMRLKNVTVSYNLPTTLLEKTKLIRTFRVYVSGNNLATWFDDEAEAVGLDPEVNQFGDRTQLQGETFFSLPQAKSVQVGVNIGF